MRGRFPPLVLGVLIPLLFAGCQTTADVAIELDENATGKVSVQVELDDAAAQRVGDLTDLVEEADLETAGWTVSTAERRVLAEKRVVSADEVDRALDELGAPFAGLSFDRHQTFARTELEVAGSVDLSQGMAAFGDEDLKRVTGSVTGVDLPPQALALSLTVDLPGEEASNASGPGTRWDLPMGVVVPVEAASTDVNLLGLLAVAIAVLCALALIGVGVRRLVTRESR